MQVSRRLSQPAAFYHLKAAGHFGKIVIEYREEAAEARWCNSSDNTNPDTHFAANLCRRARPSPPMGDR
jgi:hypothetical protein